MTFYNITQSYLAQLDGSFISKYKRWRSQFSLDGYHADSLSEALEGFRKYPPKKKDRQLNVPSAYLYLENLEVRLLDEERAKRDFDIIILHDEDDRVPYLELRDKTHHRLAMYCSLSEREFLEDAVRFTLNYESFSQVPVTLIQYIQHKDSNQLIVKNFSERIYRRPKLKRKNISTAIDYGAEVDFGLTS
jgi:hypothetical protein